MASTSRKKSSTGRSSAPRRRAASSSGARKKGGSSRRSKPAGQPVRREVGALVCLLLALFSVLGCFGVQAIFIDFLAGSVKGLIGGGYWFLPAALLGCSSILAFHRGRPVCLRVSCALLLPVMAGAILHLFCSSETFFWNNSLMILLWRGGQEGTCGGVVSGLLTLLLSTVFSRLGAALILFLTTAALVMGVCRLGPQDILDWICERPWPEYQVRPDPPERPARRVRRTEPLPLPVSSRSAPARNTPARSAPPRNAPPRNAPPRSTARRRIIDIPVDDGPVRTFEDLDDREVNPESLRPPEKKKSFFNRSSRVPSPDQLIGPDFLPEPRFFFPEEPGTPLFPEAFPEAEPDPPPAPAPAAGRKKKESVSLPREPEPPRLEPEDPPPVPEIIREPAVTRKLKKGEAARAAVQVEREAVERLSQPASDYQRPSLSLLDESEEPDTAGVAGELRANQGRLEDAIHSFGIDASVVDVIRGPSITRYEVELDQGVRLNKLTNLADDIALALGASGVRIAPIPGKISVVGIEVPNQLVTTVSVHEVIASKVFQKHPSPVAFAVGKDISGSPIVGDISKLPHMLIAGTTGSGKSVCTNSLIISLLYKATPEEVRLIMVDPKMVELGIYNGIPHLLIPVVTDPKKAAGALQWAVGEMMKRYQIFSEAGVRKLDEYNAKAARNQSEEMEKMPAIVVVIDELADLMLVAAKEVEESICRVAQMGRAAGIHLIIATQRPSADVITGLMKANIPSRIAFAVASSLESRIILDQVGAEKLVGRGDMLYFPIGEGKPARVQGCFISDEEVSRVTAFIKDSGAAVQYDEAVMHDIERNVSNNEKGGKEKGGKGASPSMEDNGSYDELLPAAIEVVVETGMASVSMLQRRLKLGYSRAARLVDQMEEKGIVGPFEGSKPRQVLISKAEWQEMQYRQGMVDKAPEDGGIGEPPPVPLPTFLSPPAEERDEAEDEEPPFGVEESF